MNTQTPLTPTPTPSRSSQADICQIDNELNAYLIERLKNLLEFTSIFNGFMNTTITSQLCVEIASALFMFFTSYKSPAMMITGLKPVDHSSSSNKDMNSGKRQLGACKFWLWMAGGIIIPKLDNLLREYLQDSIEMDANQDYYYIAAAASSSGSKHSEIHQQSLKRIQRARRRRKKLKMLLLNVLSMVKLLHQCLFLATDFVPPTLAMWIAGVRFAHDEDSDSKNITTIAAGRPINHIYTHKRILYAQGLKTTMAILSSLFLFRATTTSNSDGSTAINNNSLNMDQLQLRALSLSDSIMSRLKSIVCIKWPPLLQRKIKADASNKSSCSICRAVDASIPYRASPCGHIFCYVCLRMAVLDSEEYQCHQCGRFVESSSPCARISV